MKIPLEKITHQISDLPTPAVNDDRRPAAGPGNMSPNVEIAVADLSLNMPTWASVSINPNFDVLSPNLLPTWPKTIYVHNEF